MRLPNQEFQRRIDNAVVAVVEETVKGVTHRPGQGELGQSKFVVKAVSETACGIADRRTGARNEFVKHGASEQYAFGKTQNLVEECRTS